MKFEDLLMQPGEDNKQTKLQLQEQVERLQQELDLEIQLKKVLQCAAKGPFGCCQSCLGLFPLIPFKVQTLLSELSLLEEEIDWLESKVDEINLDVYKEQQQTIEWQQLLQPQWEERQLRKLSSRQPYQIQEKDSEILMAAKNMRYTTTRARRASLGSPTEFQTATSQGKFGKFISDFRTVPSLCLQWRDFDDETSFLSALQTEDISRDSRGSKSPVVKNLLFDTGREDVNPNVLSVELIKCLIGIFLSLNQQARKSKGSSIQAKNTLTCMNSRGLLASKSTFSCRVPVRPFIHHASHLDPYAILPEQDMTIRDVGPYKNFIQITRSTLDRSRLSECIPSMRRLSVLMQKLSNINVDHLTHKQKLAFWINVYNASIMHAFLQHGLPSTQEKLLSVINEAEIGVAGFVLKASAIMHILLRHPADIKHDIIDEKEMLLRHACGLGYPEPNVTFALCRGSWSSPALRFYTSDEVMNELERAKAEYLEASVGVTSRKKVLLPKLLDWHMKEFADDMESLLEWIYSQLRQTSSIKRMMMECLNGEIQSPTQKLIEIQPYATEFRYLIPI